MYHIQTFALFFNTFFHGFAPESFIQVSVRSVFGVFEFLNIGTQHLNKHLSAHNCYYSGYYGYSLVLTPVFTGVQYSKKNLIRIHSVGILFFSNL